MRRDRGPPRAGRSSLLSELKHLVADRFERLTGQQIVVAEAPRDEAGRGAESVEAETHPLCRQYEGRPACRRCRPTTDERFRDGAVFSGRCPFGLQRAEYPVVLEGRLAARCVLVCPPSTCRERLENELELLGVLVENAVRRHGGAVGDEGAARTPPGETAGGTAGGSSQSLIEAAIAYIETHLRDERLRVGEVACRLGVNAAYLAHAFHQRIGRRMSRYIAARRLRRARLLIVNTDWQIKRIAHECGWRDANWFSYKFREQTGHTPTEYRRLVRRWRRPNGSENNRFHSR